jgi:hypothetical protein
MTTRYHLLTSAEAQIARVARSVCIALIDESDPLAQAGTAALSADWTTFRTTYPLRPYWLVQVDPTGGRLGIPTNMQSSIINDPLTRALIVSQSSLYPLAGEAAYRFTAYDSTTDASVNPNGIARDNGTVGLATNLFSLCNLSALQPGDNVFLYVDNSGSMTVANVRATLDLLQTNCNAVGIEITSVFNAVENYVQPFINFVGTPGVP